MSNLKRLEGELSVISASSTFSVNPENHCIVSITTKSKTALLPLIKRFLKAEKDAPIGIYHHKNTMHLIFLCDENMMHQGNYCLIVSELCSLCVLELQEECKVMITQFETKVRLLTFLLNEIRKNITSAYSEVSGGKITESDLSTLTEGELKEKLKELGFEWKKVPPSQKFGVLYTLEGGILKKTSARPSSTNFDTYKTALFG